MSAQKLIYREHVRDPREGWRIVQQSDKMRDFSESTWWAFEAIAKHGHEYIRVGETMWDIECAQDLSRDAYNRWLDSKYDEVTIMHWTVPASYAFQNLEPNEYEQSYEEWVYWQNNPSEYLERTGEDINNPMTKERAHA
jgi:hypothetical protein